MEKVQVKNVGAAPDVQPKDSVESFYTQSPERILHTEENLPLVMTVEDIMAVLGIGRNSAYNLVRSGQIKAIHIGRQIRIARHELLRYRGLLV